MFYFSVCPVGFFQSEDSCYRLEEVAKDIKQQPSGTINHVSKSTVCRTCILSCSYMVLFPVFIYTVHLLSSVLGEPGATCQISDKKPIQYVDFNCTQVKLLYSVLSIIMYMYVDEYREQIYDMFLHVHN